MSFDTTASFSKSFPITPSDDNDLSHDVRGLYIGVTGDVTFITVEGDTDTYYNHPVGYLPGQIKRVKATGTTATQISGFY